MKHIWTVLCQKSLIDQETNLISLLNCIEQINLTIDRMREPGEELVISDEFQLVSFWIIENQNKDNLLEVKIELVDPKGKVIRTLENKQSIKKGILRFRNRINIKGLPLTEDGRYTIKMTQKKDDKKQFETVAELPLDIKITYKLTLNPRKS